MFYTLYLYHVCKFVIGLLSKFTGKALMQFLTCTLMLIDYNSINIPIQSFHLCHQFVFKVKPLLCHVVIKILMFKKKLKQTKNKLENASHTHLLFSRDMVVLNVCFVCCLTRIFRSNGDVIISMKGLCWEPTTSS